jgi:hypothetical protein
MRSSPTITPVSDPATVRRLGAFEDRYGLGAFDRLRALLAQPCVTFAEIAEQFGVTRERVRQWHLELMPEAPRGHARKRLCSILRQKRALLSDPLFRSFYRHARGHLGSSRFRPVAGREGFRKRLVELDRQMVLIKEAHRLRRESSTVAYSLNVGGATVAFIYYRLTESEFLFIPRHALPPSGTTFFDSRHSKYQRFRNAFAPAFAEVRAGDESTT